MTHDEVIKRLKAHITTQHATQRSFAAKYEVTPQFVNAVLSGSKTPPQWMLDLVDVKITGTVRIHQFSEK